MVVPRGEKPDGFVRLRNQNQTLSTTSAAVFISVIFHPSTYQFVAISFFLEKARAYCNFWGRSIGGGGVGGRDRVRLGLGLGKTFKVKFHKNCENTIFIPEQIHQASEDKQSI